MLQRYFNFLLVLLLLGKDMTLTVRLRLKEKANLCHIAAQT